MVLFEPLYCSMKLLYKKSTAAVTLHSGISMELKSAVLYNTLTIHIVVYNMCLSTSM